MGVTVYMDLQGMISTMALLKCKSRLKTLEKNDILEVHLSDPDVVKDLSVIIERSKDQIRYTKKEESHICLGIQKG